MARPKRVRSNLLKLLKEKAMTNREIRNALRVRRETVWRNIKDAENNSWIEIDRLQRYHLTRLGESVIELAERPVDSVSLEANSQIIDFIKIRPERPKAKCTIVIKNAKKIKEMDDQTIYFERFITHDGLGLAENNTYLKQAVAAIVDTLLDFKAKEKGLLTILDQQFRDTITSFNSDTYYPSYDYRKRCIDLANIDFKVLIEFEGKKWVESQNFEDLEKNIECNLKFYDISEDIK